MGRRSSVRGDFVHVKTVVGLERFEVGKSSPATTSFSVAAADRKSCFKSASNRAASSLGYGCNGIRCVELCVKILMFLERFEVDKSRAFSLDFSEILEITEILEILEILEIGCTNEWFFKL